MPITVVLVDDHVVVRNSLRALLNADGHFKVLAEAKNGREAIRKVRVHRSDIILMDISMPIMDGLEATRRIVAADPFAKVIILSAYDDLEYVGRARAMGAAGFLPKQTFAETLTKALRKVHKGCAFFPSVPEKRRERSRKRSIQVKTSEQRSLVTLDSRVFQLLVDGVAFKQVAATLHISVDKVAQSAQRLMAKLNLDEVADIARFAGDPDLGESSVELTIT